MPRDDPQLALACRTLLASVRLERLWTDQGLTAEVTELLKADGGPLSSGERVMLLAAWAFWTGRAASPSPTFSSGSMETRRKPSASL
jgi:hypothetical protein